MLLRETMSYDESTSIHCHINERAPVAAKDILIWITWQMLSQSQQEDRRECILLQLLYKYLPDHLSLIHGHPSSKSYNPFLEVTFSMFFEFSLKLWKAAIINVIFYKVTHFPIDLLMHIIVNLQCYHLAFPLKFSCQQALL